MQRIRINEDAGCSDLHVITPVIRVQEGYFRYDGNPWEKRELPEDTVILVVSGGVPTDVLVADEGPVVVSAYEFHGQGLTCDHALRLYDAAHDYILYGEPRHADRRTPFGREQVTKLKADMIRFPGSYPAGVHQWLQEALEKHDPDHVFVTN